jgi:hypothetical protein
MRWSALGSGPAATCVVAAALLTGCSSGRSKPAVCTDIDNLQTLKNDAKSQQPRRGQGQPHGLARQCGGRIGV